MIVRSKRNDPHRRICGSLGGFEGGNRLLFRPPEKSGAAPVWGGEETASNGEIYGVNVRERGWRIQAERHTHKQGEGGWRQDRQDSGRQSVAQALWSACSSGGASVVD